LSGEHYREAGQRCVGRDGATLKCCNLESGAQSSWCGCLLEMKEECPPGSRLPSVIWRIIDLSRTYSDFRVVVAGFSDKLTRPARSAARSLPSDHASYGLP